MGIRGVWLKVRSLLSPGKVERELDDELRFHIEMESEENLRRGMRPEDARREAYRRFGGLERFKEQARDVRGTRWLEDLGRDGRHGVRALLRSPGFTAAAVLTLTLGVGATTAVFSVVRGVLLRPLPFEDAHELVTVWYRNPPQGIDEDIASYPNFAAWREGSGTLEHVVGVRTTRTSLTGEGSPEEVTGAFVTRGFFEMLGVPPELGRGFRADESEGEGSARVVVLSHELWTRRFGADPAVLGRTILLNDVAYEVVGVAPAGRRYPLGAELWMPLTFEGQAGLREARGALWLPVVGRLAPDVTLAGAQAEMTAIGARLAEEHPDDNAGTGVKLEPLHETLVGDVSTPLLTLLGAVVLVLLIAAANVANLLLARGTARAREMAVRLSLGAGRGRLARQVLTESAVLGAAGGSLGALAAVLGVDLLLRASPPDLPRIEGVAVDLPVLVFALGVALGTSLLFGLVPALHAGRAVAAADLREGGRTASEGGLGRLRAAFVAAQFALALVLLVGSGLLMRSFLNLQAVDPGFEPRGVLSFRLALPERRYPDAAAVRAFYDEMLPALEALPGVERAAAISRVFHERLTTMAGISLESRPELETLENPVPYDGATPGFLEALGMRLASGRSFGPGDEAGAPRVAVVSQTFVRTFLPERDPLGERFSFGGPSGDDSRWITIVGVVEDAKRAGLDATVRPYVFLPMAQFVDRRADLLLRTSGDPLDLAEAARGEVARLDPALPISGLRTLEQAFSGSLARRRFITSLLAVFAAAATLLAAIGVYGVMAYLVGRRTREIGIQVALGASRRAVLASVLRQALRQAVGGVAIGLLGALVATPFLSSQLFGLEPTDPATFLAVSSLLVLVALLASWLPARRATRIHPAEALRVE